jgi:hypothetical protein
MALNVIEHKTQEKACGNLSASFFYNSFGKIADLAGTLEQTFVIPSSLYKEDIEQFDKQLIDFFIAYENKTQEKACGNLSASFFYNSFGKIAEVISLFS